MPYSYYRSETVTGNSGLLPSTQTNFPLLVSFVNATLKTFGNGGHVQNSNGYDIVFATDNAGTSLLSWEMEYYDPTTGTVVAWVKIPSLALGTLFYCVYGNGAISTFQGGSTGAAWDSDFKGVYHLPNGSSLNSNDSTSNGNNGTNNFASAVAGKIDGAASFDGSSSFIQLHDDLGTTGPTSEFTLSAWVNPGSAQSPFDRRPALCMTSNNTGDFNAYIGSPIDNSGYLSIEVADVFNSSQSASSIDPYDIGSWYYVVGVFYNGGADLYVNGIYQSSIVYDSNINGTNPVDFDWNIGAEVGDIYFWNGLIDEVRLSDINRGGNWITAEFNNQYDPETFVVLGSEVPIGGSVNSGFFNLFK